MAGGAVEAADDPRTVLFERDDRGLSVRCIAGRGSRVLAVVFSQVRVPAGRFGLSRLFARTRHACLFLNQPVNDWYRGVDAGVDCAIDEAVARNPVDRVVLYGSSMGAWGALAAATRHPSADVIAFAPDFRVGEPGSQSAAAGLTQSGPTLADLLAHPRPGTTTVVSGLFDPYDAGVAARLVAACSPGLRVVPVASGHEVHDHLYSVNVIRRVIMTFARDVATESAERGLLIAAPDWSRAAAFADCARRLADGEAVEPAAIAALGLDHPGVALLQAEAFEHEGDLLGAEACLAGAEAAIDASPTLRTLPKRYRKEFPRRRIRLLLAAGLADRAETVRAAAAAAFPEDAGFAAQ